MDKKIEILAPAGTKESFIGAINAGCHAVYLAGKRFGARAYAANFSDEELVELIKEAHLNSVKVYVAVNTIIYNDEVSDLIEYTDFLVNNNVDAFIVQDLGMIDLFIHRYPDTEIHASTQTNVHTFKQAKFLTELGVKRIVVARETPLSVIKEIKDNLNVEIEAFVQGALCVCYSGNCLMSSMIGGRSGNRGECAQPCRLPYTLYKENDVVSDETYLLSTKDLMTLDYVNEMIEAGIDSFKIEGRMRKPEYVIQSVLSYKKAISDYNRKIKNDYSLEIEKLRKVFNRDYTKGYMFSERPKYLNQSFRPNHIGTPLGKVINVYQSKVTIRLNDTLSINDGYRILSKKDSGNIVTRIMMDKRIVTSAKKGDIVTIDHKDKVYVNDPVVKTTDFILEKELNQYLVNRFKTVGIKGTVIASSLKKLKFIIEYQDIKVEKESLTDLLLATSKPITKQELIERFSKTADMPFYFSKIDIITDEKAFISIKEMNQLRRDVIEEFKVQLLMRKAPRIVEHSLYEDNFKEEEFKVVFKPGNKKQANYLENELLYGDYTYNLNNDIVRGLKRINEIGTYDSKALIHDFGMLEKREYTISSEYMNVTNIYTANLLSRYGVNKVTLSLELNKDRINSFSKQYEEKFNNKPNLEVIIYGKPDLMISKYCPIAKTFDTDTNCNLCRMNQYYLKDKLNAKYPLINDGNCNIRVLHSKAINLIDKINELKKANISSVRINLTDETQNDIDGIIKLKNDSINHKVINIDQQKYTQGRY